MPTPDFYPIASRVVLQGLQKAPELNGKVGVVKSGLFNGRQHVMVDGLNKSVALKVSNMAWEGRSLDSLSVKELKTILKAKARTTDSELSGIDKSELQSKVASLDASPETIAQWLAELAEQKTTDTTTPASTSSSSSSPSSSLSVDPAQAASQLANMDPEQLRQQARMLRSIPPDQIRRMNPQMAGFSDAQILAAASQMEMMASNPAMMRMASEQVKNMSPEDLLRAQQQAMGGGAAIAAAGGSPAAPRTAGVASASGPSTSQTSQAASVMENMTPEQMRQQADMFASMPPDQIRQLNPQLAHMTDAQIKMAATQFRMMADNPEMMKMAADQMKNMTPEQLENIRNGTIDPSLDPSPMNGADPAKMFASLDKNQLRSMLKTLKENPDMMKQFAASSGLSQDQLAKGVEMFADMDDAKLEMTVNMMQKVQKAKDLWTRANATTGGHLLKILLVLFVVIVGLLFQRFFLSSSSIPASNPSFAVQDIPDIVVEKAVAADEFESEF